jgi:hypothetical protein
MSKTIKHNNRFYPRPTLRRELLRLAAGTDLLAGCASVPQPLPTPTEEPISTLAPTLTLARPPIPICRPEIIRFYPDAPSKVVRTHHAGVWSGDELAPEAIRQMLDASISELTGLDDAAEAWAAVFDPGEWIAIKVNTSGASEVWTHVPLTLAVAEALQDVGVPAEQIVIFDRYTDELIYAGYTINRDGPGVRCYGIDRDYADWDRRSPTGWRIAGLRVRLSKILLACDALINIPVLKAHSRSGVTFAMRNHYGTLDKPEDFHSSELVWCGSAGLNALPPIRDRTRLVIGDALWVSLQARASVPWWILDAVGDAILMSYDPVAHDTVGLDMLNELIKANDGSITWASRLGDLWLQNAAELGLGTNDPQHIELVEVDLR